jgi:putative ABC transport system ATP-binding protein
MEGTLPEGILETQDLTMVFRSGKIELAALRGVNLKVNRGEFIAIMGPSGCGKSTLLHLLGGLLQPTSGHILVAGTDITKLKDSERTALRRQKIGYVFQRFNLLPTLSAKANIELARRIQKNGHICSYTPEEIVDMLELTDKMQLKPVELSGGEQQRVAIARAIINNPAIVLADEPTGSLDSRNSRTVLRILRELNDKLRQTIVMITHDAEAASTANRVIEMRDGQIFSRKSRFFYEPEFEGLF